MDTLIIAILIFIVVVVMLWPKNSESFIYRPGHFRRRLDLPYFLNYQTSHPCHRLDRSRRLRHQCRRWPSYRSQIISSDPVIW